MVQSSSSRATGWGILALSVIGMVLVWIAFAGQYVDSREIESQCSTDVPAGAIVTEDATAYASQRTFIPAGRLCTYPTEDGGTVSVQTGWPSTIGAFIGSALGAVALALSWGLWRRTTAMQQVLIHAVVLALGLGWVSMANFAALG